MPQDSREARAETSTVFFSWGGPMEGGDSFLDDAAPWLGGVSLLLWTVLYFVLTSV
jgi:hypothetical protein